LAKENETCGEKNGEIYRQQKRHRCHDKINLMLRGEVLKGVMPSTGGGFAHGPSLVKMEEQDIKTTRQAFGGRTITAGEAGG